MSNCEIYFPFFSEIITYNFQKNLRFKGVIKNIPLSVTLFFVAHLRVS